ncbi:MAG: hypothetical protein PHO20_05415, partial [Candidatus Peribacteraceae bacterium]|nr:hypothetical protein [Candidatus Peribacteraceae bacterium]
MASHLSTLNNAECGPAKPEGRSVAIHVRVSHPIFVLSAMSTNADNVYNLDVARILSPAFFNRPALTV